MVTRWTKEEEFFYKKQLKQLYVTENLSIQEVANVLKMSDKGVYDRLVRLNIKTTPNLKVKYLNRRPPVRLPRKSNDLAEFLGIMLGDGHVAHFQTLVTLGTKEKEYVIYVQKLMTKLFQVPATATTNKKGYSNVYIGSVEITKFLKQKHGLVQNKVKAQVDVPSWIFERKSYMKAFCKGFFDTDGSIYRLKFGVQISITNYSKPLLLSLQRMLRTLGYSVSEISVVRFYITKRSHVERFFAEIQPANSKHCERYKRFMRRSDSGYSRRL
ncbi:hypothetical protein COB87_002665 [Candidatus Wolfebacteria bacterium]|nr:hypothetical protein [Candidatus Wolfebacteria bacterium]